MAFTTYIATSTALVGSVVSALNTGFFDLVYTVMPYAIMVLLFFIGLAWARRALGGR